MKRVQIILRTSAIECDDRLRKQAEHLSKSVSIFLSILQASNKSARSKCWGGVPYHSISLWSRCLTRPKVLAICWPVFLLFRMFEFYCSCLIDYLKYRPQIVWMHNIEVFALTLPFSLLRRFGVVEKIVWDLYELPGDEVLRSPLKRRIFSYFLSLCDHVIIAHPERKRLLVRLKMVGSNAHCIENHPDQKFFREGIREIPPAAIAWSRGGEYYLAQGGGMADRYFQQLLTTFVRQKRKLIVIGEYREDIVEQLRAEFRGIDNYFYFTGVIPQKDIIPYIDHAIASVILYSQEERNGKYCAPNRLYQALARGGARDCG